MPTITRQHDWAITMYLDDHATPHFHVRKRDGREALVVIETLETLTGTLKPHEMKDALVWASENKAVLAAKWKEFNP